MRKLIFIFSGIIIFSWNTGCNNSKYAKEKAQIDSLNIMIEKAEAKLNNIDDKEVDKKFEIYQKNLNEIKDNFNDKREEGVWDVIVVYGNIKKPLKSYLKNNAKYHEEIEYSKKQLKNLYHDYKKGLITKEKFDQYYNTEKTVITGQYMEITSTIDWAKANIKLFDSLNPKINVIIQKLKKEKGNSPKSSKVKIGEEEEGEDD
ncbi:MAG: hypothetical protein Q8880_00905 [Bacteroidota bacterium]|nr:hypothetical protein [Bacteroidota bacterium]